MSHIAYVTEVRYDDNYANSHKFYRTYALQDEETGDYRLLLNWGRIGSTGQFKLVVYPYPCQSAAREKIAEKTRKGYVCVREESKLSIVPEDILLAAGINVRSVPKEDGKDSFAAVIADVDTAIRLASGPTDDQVQAVVMCRSLTDRLNLLHEEFTDAQSRLEMAQMLVTHRVGA